MLPPSKIHTRLMTGDHHAWLLSKTGGTVNKFCVCEQPEIRPSIVVLQFMKIDIFLG